MTIDCVVGDAPDGDVVDGDAVGGAPDASWVSTGEGALAISSLIASTF